MVKISLVKKKPNISLVKKGANKRKPKKSELTEKVESNLQKAFGKEVNFIKQTYKNPNTSVYFVAVNPADYDSGKANSKIYHFVHKCPQELPKPIAYTELVNKKNVIHFGHVGFEQTIRKLAKVNLPPKKEKEYIQVHFFPTSKLAKLASDKIINPEKINKSDLGHFKCDPNKSQLQVIK